MSYRAFMIVYLLLGSAAAIIYDQYDTVKYLRSENKTLTQENKDVRNDLGYCQGDMRGDPNNHDNH